MNVLIVDTSVWIEYFRGEGQHDDLEVGLKEGRVYLPPIVTAELMSAKMHDSKRQKLLDFLGELPLCTSDFDHWVRVGRLRANLLSHGFTVSTPDAHIAQCALDLNGYLLSTDAIFRKIAKTAQLKSL